MKQAIIILLCVFAAPSLFGAPEKSTKMPPADYVMARLWRNFSMQKAEMKGILRTPGKIYPIIMTTDERDILLDVPGANLSIRVSLASDKTAIKRGKSGGKDMAELTAAQKKEKILDTDITYEDLGLKFLNWPDIREVGTDNIKTLASYAYDVEAPAGQSNYKSVRFWISSEYFALLRVDGLNAEGLCIKRVEVNGVMKVGNSYVIKEMMISSFTPGRTSSKSRTYLEIQEAKIL
ncbi:MAG: outer membrane lipoprotein-sorting protein [Verrucomicrobiae bacterium]|nr:outer membrane lipoprotein-sorting protein [Verrucomicrobiae bacterium]